MLLKLGYNRNTSKKVVFGSQFYLGLGLRHLYVEQGIAQINIIMRHIRVNTDLGTLTEIVLHWWQTNAGVSYSLLEKTSSTIKYTGETWFTSLHLFLHTLNGTLRIPSIHQVLPKKLRTHDRFLMDDLEHHNITHTERRRFNNVRLWMRVYRLSEICTVDGHQVSLESWTGQHITYTNHLWPMQAKPGPKSFRCWRRMLSRMYLKHKTVSIRTKNLDINTELGSSESTSEWLRKKWEYQYSPSSNKLFHRQQTQHRIHSYKRNSRRWTRSQQRVRLFFPTPIDITDTLPVDVIPVDGIQNAEHISISGSTTIIPMIPSRQPTTWDQYARTLTLWEQQLIGDIKIHSPDKLKTILLQQEPLFLCSDGGAVRTIGSFGAVIASATEILMELQGQAYGNTPRSFRSESYGMLAYLRYLLHFKFFHDITIRFKQFMICDNSGLLQRVSTIAPEPST